MKRKNWIWFAVAFVVLAAFVAGVALLRSGARHIAPTYSAPPPMQIETPVQQTPPKATTEPEVEPSVPGVLDMGLLRERCQAVLGLEARNAYPVEETEIVEGGVGARFARTLKQAPALIAGEPRFYSFGEDAVYQLSDADAPAFRLCGDNVEDTLTRAAETYTGASVPAFVIACGENCLRLAGETLGVSDVRQATRWAEEPDTGFWYTYAGGRKRYLNSDGLGDTGRTRWTLEGGELQGRDADGEYALCFDGNWTLSAAGAFCLSDGDGHLLNMDSSGVLPDTTRGTRWSFDRDDTGPGGYFRTHLNGRRYTLCIRNGQLALGDDPFADYWVYSGGALTQVVDGVSWCVRFREGAWRAEPVTAWRISDGEHYLSADAGGVINETAAERAALWRIEDAGDGVVICTAEETPRYLGFEENHLLLQAGRRTLWQRSEDSLRAGGGALVYRDLWSLGAEGRVRLERVSLPAPALREVQAGETATVELLPAEELQVVERGETSERPVSMGSCVPICCGDSLAPEADNPGYLCPGQTPMRLTPMGGAAFSAGLAEGQMQAMTRSAADSTLHPARADEGEFGKNCRYFLEHIPAEGVWGLRLSGEPRMDDLAVLPQARFGGRSQRDCELVRSAVDLRLADSGTLSLFFGGSGGEFRLYSVERDPETGRISDLRRISRIFQGKDRFVYDYAEGGLPVREDAVLLFDTAWLTGDAGEDAVCYYEIPLNAGEFALSGTPEAALLYLSVSEGALAEAPTEQTEVWDRLSDRALLTFLGDGANSAALSARLRAGDAASLVERVQQIADGAWRERAAALVELLQAVPQVQDWHALPDAAFVQWLCDPANGVQVQARIEEDRSALEARIASLVSHGDYFRALDRLNELTRR